MEKTKVYFCKDITPENVVKLYKTLGKELTGNVAIKVHSGEDGNQNFLRPEFWRDIVDYVKGTIVECNTAYGERFGDGKRDFTEDHLKVIEKHGWNKYFDVDIMDKDSDIEIDVPGGEHIKKDIVGKGMEKYDSMLVLSHFKGHPMGGFGGALKQLSIGCASRAGKALIHSAGVTTDPIKCWDNNDQDGFLESMAEAASAVVKYFKGNMVFINVMANMSVDCDCCSVAEDPCMKDMGILISLDPIAIDQACIDLVENSNDPGKAHFMERVNSRNGIHTIEKASELGFGTREYELIIVE
jgi:hypothetical protein